MERIKNIYRTLIFALVSISGLFVTSCDDYLTIIPPKDVVHEDFWHTEEQVRGMMANAYIELCSPEAIERLIIWGELRSETVTRPATSQNESILNLLEAELYDDNGYATWDKYYSAISSCNLVMKYGSDVVANDPNFTAAEMTVAEGEMRALRAYAHFVLLRAFCNIPLATTIVMSDEDMPQYPQVTPMEALNAIYSDLEIASTKVLRSTAPTKTSIGTVTTNAVYAMMADVDMWRAAFAKYYQDKKMDVVTLTPDEYYRMAIENCKKVLDRMDEVQKEQAKLNNKELDPLNKYHLIQIVDRDKDVAKYGTSQAYDINFGTDYKEKSEAIFEFLIENGNHAKSGAGISPLYGYSEKGTGAKLIAAAKLIDKYKTDDIRRYAYISTWNEAWGTATDDHKNDFIRKYITRTSPDQNGEPDYRKEDEFNVSWSVYRKPDVMLMMAEALLLLSEPYNATKKDDVALAFELAYENNKRWKVDATKDPLKLDDPEAVDACLEIVRDERSRELCFEGKRWFDVVRMALMGEDTSFSYQGKNLDASDDQIGIRFGRISTYFMPIHKEEIRFNPLLKQNESCKSSESDNSVSKN